MKEVKTIALSIIGIAACAFIISSCVSGENKEKVEESNSQPSAEVVKKTQTKRKPKVSLQNEVVRVQKTGAGACRAEACVYLDSQQTNNVKVVVRAHSDGKQVGLTTITIEAGNLQGCETFRLDGFYGMFEDRIPSMVTLSCSQVN